MKIDPEFAKRVDLKAVSKAKDELGIAFVWGSSPQGYDAWANVWVALREIENAAKKAKKVKS